MRCDKRGGSVKRGGLSIFVFRLKFCSTDDNSNRRFTGTLRAAQVSKSGS